MTDLARARPLRTGLLLPIARRLRGFARDRKGVAAVEFAFVAPILLLLFVGTIELSAGVSTSRKLARLSSTLSDLVTQSQVLTASDVEAIMDASAKVMYPYSSQVKIILTGVQISAGQAKVVWSKARNDTAFAAGTAYTVPSQIRTDGTFLVAAKVSTTYTPTVGWASYTNGQFNVSRTSVPMSEEIFLRPRIGNSVTVN